MNKNLQDIDHLFFRGLKDYEEDPPESTWEKIDNELNRKDAENYKTKYKSLRRTLSSIILMCICFFLGDVLRFALYNSAQKEAGNIISLKRNISELSNHCVIPSANVQDDKGLERS